MGADFTSIRLVTAIITLLSFNIPAGAVETPVTITITRIVEQCCALDGGNSAADFYVRVNVSGSGSDSFDDMYDFPPCDPDIFPPTGCIGPELGPRIREPIIEKPRWLPTPIVQGSLRSFNVAIELWDNDRCQGLRPPHPPCSSARDDLVDIDPNPSPDFLAKRIDLILDRATGRWSGDVSWPQNCSQGTGSKSARICWSISALSANGDADGDGLLDDWELNGYNDDGDNTIDVNLPAFRANPRHKDLFLEFDWMVGNAPTRAQIQAIKAAFASAPLNAGTIASSLNAPNNVPGMSARINPDGLPGINLWVDTGSLVDPNATEDGAGPTSCNDGMDNGGGDETGDGNVNFDGTDPECLVGDNLAGGPQQEDSAGPNSCGDGMDNGRDGVTDGADADCAGGNQLPATAIPNVNNPAFYTAKNTNFDKARRFIFRYGISAAPGFEDGSAAGNSCFDGIDNGGGDENGDGVIEIDGRDPDCGRFGGGWGEIGGNDFIEYNHDGGTIMHEFGHTLNLRHGGNVDANCKPNYVSVMNYDNQFRIRQRAGGVILDFSPPRLGNEDGTGPGTCADGLDNGPDGVADTNDVDCFARGIAPLPNLVENNLDENVILDATDAINFFVYKRASFVPTLPEDGAGAGTCGDSLDNGPDGLIDRTDPDCTSRSSTRWPVNGDTNGDGMPEGVDWDGDGIPPLAGMLNTGITANIDTVDDNGTPNNLNDDFPTNCRNSVSTNTLVGHSDWPRISLPFRQFGDAANSAVNPILEREPTLSELIQAEQALNTADLMILKSAALETVEVGTDVMYQLTISNKGPNPAGPIKVTDRLPPGVSYMRDTANCIEEPAGLLTCVLGEMHLLEQRQIDITVGTAGACEAEISEPIINSASVENAAEFAGPDPEPGDNSTTAITSLTDTAPPQLTVTVLPTILSPANRRLTSITATIAVTDACDPNPEIRLASITSEPEDGFGDKDGGKDIQGAAFGTDDRSFRLRALGGRTYTITYEAEDFSGNLTAQQATVAIPVTP